MDLVSQNNLTKFTWRNRLKAIAAFYGSKKILFKNWLFIHKNLIMS